MILSVPPFLSFSLRSCGLPVSIIGPIVNVIPKQCLYLFASRNYADDDWPGLSVRIFVKRYLLYPRAVREDDNAAQLDAEDKVEAIELCACDSDAWA